jgi:tetratricopeptide (TPR) repeat protein
MSAVASMRRTLRSIPAFQELDTEDLDRISKAASVKRYAVRTHIWLSEKEENLQVIVHCGEVDVQGFTDRSLSCHEILKAGELFDLTKFRNQRRVLEICLHVKANTTLYFLGEECQQPREDSARVRASSTQEKVEDKSRLWLWGFGIAIILMLLFWTDLSHLFAGGLYLFSDRLYAMGRTPRALRMLKYAAIVDPDAYYAKARTGYLLYTLGDFEGAEELFRQSLKVDDGYSPTLNNLAVVDFENTRNPSALELQRAAVKAAPNSAVVRYNLGWMWLSQGNNQQAEYAFREAARIDPEWNLPYIYLGFVHLKNDEYLEAANMSRIALQIDQDQPVAYMILAIALYNQNSFQHALETLKPVVEAYPDAILPKLYRALIFEDLGRYQEAMNELKVLHGATSNTYLKQRILLEIERIEILKPNLVSVNDQN